MTDPYEAIIERAARAISKAEAILIGAGAGMGVDSGLPDFRGDTGFWNAYPPFKGKSFSQVSNPRMMQEDPEQAWGFYGHRLNLYRSTKPHNGFQIIKKWAEKVGEYFVYTSNVDGHFIQANFDEERVVEIHGSIHYMQCTRGFHCKGDIWSAQNTSINIDEESFRATSELPPCKNCESIARPNILMFGDFAWIPSRTGAQETRYDNWWKKVSSKNVVAIEFGAGTAIPTVRYECQRKAKQLIRVNPRDYQAPAEAISVPLNALEAIERIDGLMSKN